MRIVAASAAALVFSGATQFRSTAAPRHSYTIVHTYPHDPSAFTQGLEYHDGFLYEVLTIESCSIEGHHPSSVVCVGIELRPLLREKLLYRVRYLVDSGNLL